MKSKQEIIFKELFEIPLKNGLFKPTKVRGSGTKMINMGEIFAIDRIFDVPMELVPLTDVEEKNAIIKKKDLVFARSSLADGAGKCSIFLGNQKTTFESHIIRVRINQKIANPTFYYYHFNSIPGKNSVYSITVKTAASGIRGSDLANLLVPFPPKNIQDSVVNQLEILDIKIQNLQNQNKVTEQIIQSIFKSWFVDFDGQKDFVDSELGEIPKGWSVGKLDDVAFMFTGFSFKSKEFFMGTDGIKLARGDNIKRGNFQWGDKTRYWKSISPELEKYQVEEGDVLIGMDGSRIGDNFTLVCDFELPILLVQRVARLRKKNSFFQEYIWQLIHNGDFTTYVKTIKTGTAIPHISGNQISEFQIIFPDLDTLQKFQQISNPLRKIISMNKNQLQNLKQIQDSLLPKLMSGELIN